MRDEHFNENVHELYFVLALLAFCALDVLNLGLDVVVFFYVIFPPHECLPVSLVH